MQKYMLPLTVFLSGFIVLTYEILGARIIGPYYGTSSFVWTAMIGIILASLSIGYALGGRLADRSDASLEKLSRIILIAGICVGITHLTYTPFLEYLTLAIQDIRTGAVVAALILFLPASIFLGMASPYTVKLALREEKRNGSIIGDFSALGTIGSILGTFLTGYILLPYYGVSEIMGTLPLSLIILSFFLAPKSDRWIKGALITLSLLLYFASDALHARPGVIHETDTLYGHIRVIDTKNNLTDERLRTLAINIENHSSMSLDSDRLVNEYTKYYHLARHFTPDFQSALMLGGAGYSFPKDFLKTYPDKTIDVVEIDPGVTEIAKKYFSLDTANPRLRIFHEDARVFLNQNKKKYDVIFGDAFSSWYSLPYQLTTREAIQAHYDSLSDTGALIVNIIGAIEGEKGEFFRAEYHTIREVFPHVAIFPVGNPGNGKVAQNIVLVATKGKTLPSLTSDDNTLQGYLSHLWMGRVIDDMPRLTDDYAPVDHMVGKLLEE